VGAVDSWVEPVRSGVPVTPESMGEDQCTNVIWFDQGGTTGWAVFCFWPEALTDPRIKLLGNGLASWSAGEFTGSEGRMTDAMMDLIEAWPRRTLVGYEDFVLRKFSMGRELLSPVRVGARFEDRMYVAGRTLQRPQSPSDMKQKTNDGERLKQWGFWIPGQEHARDAVGHCILFASHLKDRNIKDSRRRAR